MTCILPDTLNEKCHPEFWNTPKLKILWLKINRNPPKFYLNPSNPHNIGFTASKRLILAELLFYGNVAFRLSDQTSQLPKLERY